MKDDLNKFKEKYPTYIEALDKIDELQQRIAELEEENEALKSENEVIAELEEDNKNLKQCLIEMQIPRGTMKTVTKKIVMFDTLKEECKKLQKENAKLQEQLKSNLCPKYRLGEGKWYVEENGYCNYEVQVFNGTINEISISDWGERPILYYKFDTSARYILEEEIFDSEAEAQKYLEERK